MSRLFKFLMVNVLGIFVLACGLISRPISDVQEAASTAQAFASEMPLETVQALTTAIPMDTLEAIPSIIPDFGNYFDPTGNPVAEWNGIPIMPQATAGEEFGETTYSFNAPVTVVEVQDFYNQKMEELGWTSTFSLPLSEEGGFLFYQKEDEFVTITVTPRQDGSNESNVLLQK